MRDGGPRKSNDRGRRLGVLALWLAAAVAGPGPAIAQTVDCNGLYASIQATDDAGRDNGQWGRAAAQQRSEIERTQRYADQLGCQGGGLFSDDPPPDCEAVTTRLSRMEGNLATLQAQSRATADAVGGRRASLLARYNAACVGIGGGNPSDLSQRSDRNLPPEDVPGGNDPRTALYDPDGVSDVPLGGSIMDGAGEASPRRGKAICVRTCDGGYFPLAASARESQLDGLEQLCHASCPNTEARLYTMTKEGDLTSATAAADGQSYTALPTAFKFEKSFTPACTCKPPNQTWSQALAEADKLLGDPGQHDVTVTAELSDQMARPGAVPAVKSKTAKAIKASKAAALAAATPDLSVVRDAQKGLQAPTGSHESTGIGGPLQTERVVKAGDGPTVAVKGPDGVSKRIRLIVP